MTGPDQSRGGKEGGGKVQGKRRKKTSPPPVANTLPPSTADTFVLQCNILTKKEGNKKKAYEKGGKKKKGRGKTADTVHVQPFTSLSIRGSSTTPSSTG